MTIPKRLRGRLGILPGQVLDFVEDHGKWIGVKLDAVDPLDALFGAFPSEMSTDELMLELRGLIDLP
ncbi:MAG: AbrB/MazE/SpoVT family DNA-binding domain-containing protein [Tepidiformaceae bacterium]